MKKRCMEKKCKNRYEKKSVKIAMKKRCMQKKCKNRKHSHIVERSLWLPFFKDNRPIKWKKHVIFSIITAITGWKKNA